MEVRINRWLFTATDFSYILMKNALPPQAQSRNENFAPSTLRFGCKINISGLVNDFKDREGEALRRKGLSQNEHVSIHVPTHRQNHTTSAHKQTSTTGVPDRIALLVSPTVVS